MGNKYNTQYTIYDKVHLMAEICHHRSKSNCSYDKLFKKKNKMLKTRTGKHLAKKLYWNLESYVIHCIWNLQV